ncbi:MAG: hypothetical protein JO217_04625, partial [Acidobacteriaceae bacterium]|nr:hypothetical protein [Acidobacteriaceae bacterium]
MPNNAYGIAERTRDQLTEEVAGHVRACPPGALVIGGALGALGLVRSLGRRGIPTLLIPAGYWLARSSRYVRGSLPQAPAESESDPANHLLQLAEDRKLHGWALFPCIDSAVEMISRNHERLARTFRLTTAPWSVVQWAHDKRFTYKRAAQIGL